MPLISRPSTRQENSNKGAKREERPEKLGVLLPRESHQQPRSLEDVLHDTARGVYLQGESIGLNRALRNAASELRKSIRNIPTQRNSGHNRSASDWTVQDNKSTTPHSQSNLEGRNKLLARILGEAVDELWQQQGTFSALIPAEDERMKALMMSIAKVQLTQVYLDNPTLSLSPEGTISALKPKVADSSDRERQTASARENSHATELTGASVQHEAGGSQSSADATFGKGRTPLKQGAEPMQEPSAQRPSLEQSQFSFMLGHKEPSKSTRAAVSRINPMLRKRASYSHRQNVGFLFGDAEEDEVTPRALEEAERDGDDAVFQMGTLKG